MLGECKNLVSMRGFDDFYPGCPIFFDVCISDLYDAVIEAKLLNNTEIIW